MPERVSSKLCSYISLSFCQPFLEKKPAGMKRNLTILHSIAASAFVVCQPGLVLLSFSLNVVLRRELGLPLIF